MTGSDVAAICVAVIYGCAHVYTAFQSRAAKATAEKVASSVGPKDNGETVHTILQELQRFNAYQHQRNHDLAGAVHGNALRIYLIGRALDVELPPPKEEALPPFTP